MKKENCHLSSLGLGFVLCLFCHVTPQSLALTRPTFARCVGLQGPCSADSPESAPRQPWFLMRSPESITPKRVLVPGWMTRCASASWDSRSRTLLIKDSPAAEGEGGNRCEGKIQPTTWTLKTQDTLEGGGKSAGIWLSVQSQDLRGGGRCGGFQKFLTFCLPA